MATSAAPESRGQGSNSRAKTRHGWAVAIALAAFPLPAAATDLTGFGTQTAGFDFTVSQALREWDDGEQPTFVLTDTSGNSHAIADYGGRPVLVHFFATWCEPCRPEMRALERIAAREAGNGFRIIAISVNEPDGRVRRFFEREPVSFPILLDRDRTVSKSWRVNALPTTFLLDADLLPRLVVERDLAWDTLDLASVFDALSAKRRKQDNITAAPHSVR